MTIQEYIDKLNTRFKTGISHEHSYRGDLQNLLESLVPGILAINEPERIACGAPDYIITKRNIPIGYIEAKDIGADLNSKLFKEQFDRYRKSLNNLIFTDYLTFNQYLDGEFINSKTIGQIHANKIVSTPNNFADFILFIQNFCIYVGQTIKSSSKLSKMMAGKAKLMANIIEKALLTSSSGNMIKEQGNNTLHDQFQSFKQVLIHDITEKSFADIYSQTIAYGMFAARLHDPSLENFSRQEAAVLIPKSNPFLRKLFQYIAGYDLDDRIKWIVDALADIFSATNVAELLKDFGKSTQQNDPMIHFYETFLTEYDSKLRKSRGVWYTPEPVVNFIVRAINDILKTKFGLSQGLADTSKIKIKSHVHGTNKVIEKEVHKVQILDPAAGTGTFLAEIVKQIYKEFEGQEGIWNNYLENHLLPRLNGFEILMASYSIAHLKLEMLLRETGYKFTKEQRLNIYLTNSLEEQHPDARTLFANWLSNEANEANHIKRDTPVMVVLGNPPYSGESRNNSDWIVNLIDVYKKEPSGGKLKEANYKWINNDYVKFIRLAEYLINKNTEGIIAYITSNSYLDSPIFRGMRFHLLKTFNTVYILDLHGSTKRNINDENVFDITEGVAIIIGIKLFNKEDLAEIYYTELKGERNIKYDFLNRSQIFNITYKKLEPIKPQYYFIPKNFEEFKKYNKGFSLKEFFIENSLGLLTKKDHFIIDFKQNTLKNRLQDFLDNNNSDMNLAEKYNLKLADKDKWNIQKARRALIKNGINDAKFKLISYRCFDNRYVYYDSNWIARLNTRVLKHIDNKQNFALITVRQLAGESFYHAFITNLMSEQCFISNKTKEGCLTFPLYLYSEENDQQRIEQIINRIPNIKSEIVGQIASHLNLRFINEKEDTEGTFSPIDILDYIYALLYNQTFRIKYKEFLKIEFPKIPYPKDSETFWHFVKLGSELRKIHLLESSLVDKLITSYPISGSNKIEKTFYENNSIWINDKQYFEGVPQIAWDFYIGGYQPAQKWLKDRIGNELSFEDIFHYQNIIVALVETNKLMKEIDKIKFE